MLKSIDDNNRTTIKDTKGSAGFITGSFRVVPYNYQHIGGRERQEDAFGFSNLSDEKLVENSGILAVVADGMGGLAQGEEASRIAVKVLLREFSASSDDEHITECLNRAIIISNTAVFDLALQDGVELDIGTTLCAAVIFQDKLYWISAGDSRIYHIRDGKMNQLTKDHIYLNQLMDQVAAGVITRKEAENHPEKDYLTSYLGLSELPEIDKCDDPLPLKKGDLIILCSDGLYNTLSEEEVLNIVNNDLQNIAEILVKETIAKNKRHQDNVTVAVLSCMPQEINSKKEKEED